jgi:GNAT superfamily N-acetyltransferase
MNIRIIEGGSPGYEAMLELRVRALLEPIGVPASYIDREGEKNDIFIGAFENEQITGCCVLTPRSNELIQLRQMVVEPNLQGKGVGASIVAFAEETARARGFARLMMHARDPVIPFYSKCGYVIAGPQFFEVGIGHHVMEKQLLL